MYNRRFHINFLAILLAIIWEKPYPEGKHFSEQQLGGCRGGFWMQVPRSPSSFFRSSFHSSDSDFLKIPIIHKFKLVSFVWKVVTLCRYSNGITFYKTNLEHFSAFAFKISLRAMWEKRVLFCLAISYVSKVGTGSVTDNYHEVWYCITSG